MPRLIEAKLARAAVPLAASVDAAADLRSRGVARIDGVLPAARSLAEVDIKNEIGVLYGEEAQQAFAAAKEDDVVAWPKVQAYAEAHGLLNEKKSILFKNLRQFKIARDQIEAVYDEHFTGAVCEIAWRGKGLGDDRRQRALHGAPAETLDELYEVGNKALLKYAEVMTAACPDGAVLELAPLKGRARAAAKARNEYAKNTAPATSWLFDLVRGSVMCATEEEIVRLYEALDKDPRVDIVRTKNRFDPPCFNGYRDILMNVAVRVEGDAGEEVLHLCELQIHHAPIKESEPMHKSHVTYEFFREYFLGNQDAVEQRLNMLCALPVADAENVDDLVDRVLGSDRASDTTLLLELAALLESIAEHANAARELYERALAIKEREFGRDHVEVANTLGHLGVAYRCLGNYAKGCELLERALAIKEREYGRDHVEVAYTLGLLGDAYIWLNEKAKARDVLERALAINEREYGRDHAKVVHSLNGLGTVCRDCGDNAKARDLHERALAIEEREYGRDNERVAGALVNLAITHGELGAAKSRDLHKRALAIQEREKGRDHVDVAITLLHLGEAYNSLGDNAKARDVLARSAAIFEREWGRDHRKVGQPLWNLAIAYNSLGDNAKKRDVLERVLARTEREYGRDHGPVYLLTNLGDAHGDLGDNAKKLDFYERALAIFEREHGRAAWRWPPR
ncbi:hypothetical protein JL720_4825 [Aureococcus anophagefferens]|nr:hypothetical protein JL720_4825 [Aureococcus anophagefferens]